MAQHGDGRGTWTMIIETYAVAFGAVPTHPTDHEPSSESRYAIRPCGLPRTD